MVQTVTIVLKLFCVAVIGLFGACGACGALAQEAADTQQAYVIPTELRRMRPVEVSHTLDGDTMRLVDGRLLRLAGVLAPEPPDDKAIEDWPPMLGARAALAELVEGKKLQIAHDRIFKDRYGRVLAHLIGENEAWIQAEMVRRGWVMVAPRQKSKAGASELLRLEQDARAAGLGLWNNKQYRVRNADKVRDKEGYILVEGHVVDAARVRSRIYLNFGEDYREDFTATIEPVARRLFEQAGMDPLSLAGQKLRVRGWVYSSNGPMIDIEVPEQIEIIEQTAKAEK